MILESDFTDIKTIQYRVCPIIPLTNSLSFCLKVSSGFTCHLHNNRISVVFYELTA